MPMHGAAVAAINAQTTMKIISAFNFQSFGPNGAGAHALYSIHITVTMTMTMAYKTQYPHWHTGNIVK